ncbi:MAG TPA: UDP-3-O-acyl-N-acetylglucosamine deacetylase [Burkholderiales bacterium]|nr:UDP-3-O-acyl-N-acetylglucosamine deacetylase [Burkholderiales bacterium]
MASTMEDQGKRQRTLAREFRVYGKGVHTGQPVCMTVYPGEPDTGICLLRSDQPPSRALVLARWSSVVSAQYSTDVGNGAGVSVRTVEHLLAALRLASVDNALVVLNGPEIPALDGSAAPFLAHIEDAGTVEQDAPARTIILLHPVQVREGNRYVRLSPSLDPRLTISIDYPGTPLGMQSIAAAAWNEDFLKRDIAPARTFGFAADHAALMQRGHALGADLGNTVVVDGGRIRNPGGLRYRDEFVRHKLLDAIGDLYLAGCPIRANYEGFRPGHGLNVSLLRKVFEQNSDAWALVPARTRKRVESEAPAALLHG